MRSRHRTGLPIADGDRHGAARTQRTLVTPLEPTIGVLALQGDVAEHLDAFRHLGVPARRVRRPEELLAIDGLVIPGGESTAIGRLLDVFDLRRTLLERLSTGMPAFGSCAGMILLSSGILDGRADQQPLGAIDITVRRNAFGRQAFSFEAGLDIAGITGGPLRAAFIRAPWVEQFGSQVEVLASVGDHAVAVRQGSVLATAFHPELGGDLRLHQMFLQMVRTGRASPAANPARDTWSAMGAATALAKLNSKPRKTEPSWVR